MGIVIKRGAGKPVPKNHRSNASAFSAESLAHLKQRIAKATIELIQLAALKPNPRNAKKHPPHQIALLAENIVEFGFTQPVLIDEDNTILADHARVEAAKSIPIDEIPAHRITGLTKPEKRALVLADNKLAELGEWNLEILS